ncbi:MAG: hypothetical protein QM765_14180 [Myxococcales bacterium]
MANLHPRLGLDAAQALHVRLKALEAAPAQERAVVRRDRGGDGRGRQVQPQVAGGRADEDLELDDGDGRLAGEQLHRLVEVGEDALEP